MGSNHDNILFFFFPSENFLSSSFPPKKICPIARAIVNRPVPSTTHYENVFVCVCVCVCVCACVYVCVLYISYVLLLAGI